MLSDIDVKSPFKNDNASKSNRFKLNVKYENKILAFQTKKISSHGGVLYYNPQRGTAFVRIPLDETDPEQNKLIELVREIEDKVRNMPLKINYNIDMTQSCISFENDRYYLRATVLCHSGQMLECQCMFGENFEERE